jgi:hypothetical protein
MHRPSREEKRVKIDFTRAEYRALLDLISLGEWVLAAHDVKEDPKKKGYKDVVQKVFSYAKKFGCEKLVEYDQDYEMYFETREYQESEKEEYLEKFENNTFWDELINRLSERDFINEHGIERAREMSFDERIRNIHRHEERYSEEFAKNGLERIRIDES